MTDRRNTVVLCGNKPQNRERLRTGTDELSGKFKELFSARENFLFCAFSLCGERVSCNCCSVTVEVLALDCRERNRWKRALIGRSNDCKLVSVTVAGYAARLHLEGPAQTLTGILDMMSGLLRPGLFVVRRSNKMGILNQETTIKPKTAVSVPFISLCT
ncbi:hypothetical protein NPIL_138331 [Nephila pilipes]|uniref:Uncharacterized protein n=1 Tax=Nephila pilipes TaxID=299642 RepID=A0A8X6QV76_NEPPI|nr:hypothetical protein NPIL_138331 [Nephila pilipes]